MQDVDLRGIIPAIVTPMTSNAELDLPALRRYAQWLADQGPVALAVNVDTGEGPHLTADEKRQTLETVAEADRSHFRHSHGHSAQFPRHPACQSDMDPCVAAVSSL